MMAMLDAEKNFADIKSLLALKIYTVFFCSFWRTLFQDRLNWAFAILELK